MQGFFSELRVRPDNRLPEGQSFCETGLSDRLSQEIRQLVQGLLRRNRHCLRQSPASREMYLIYLIKDKNWINADRR